MLKSLVVLVAFTFCSPVFAEELFKGKPPEGVFSLGISAGLAPLGSNGGFVSVGNIGAKIVNIGFVPDINNQVWLELGGGVHVGFTGALISGIFSSHLRWDFIVNDSWTLFAAGGVGGWVTSPAGATTFVLFPRIGAGAIYYFVPQVGLRLDISHEWSTIGIMARLP